MKQNSPHIRPAPARPFGGPFAALVSAVTGWHDARATYTALSHLSDHQLDDIGLTRSEIDRISGR